MANTKSVRAAHEIEHGRLMASGDTEAFWGWQTPAGQLRARRRAGLIARGAQLRPGMRALEIGCGTGLFTEMFASTGATIVAVDISPHLLELCRQRGPSAPRGQFVERRFGELGLGGAICGAGG